MSKPILILLAVVIGTVLAGCAKRMPQDTSVSAAHTQPALDQHVIRVRAAVEHALSSPPPRGYAPIPRDVRLLSIVRGRDDSLVLDFSRELLTGGTGPALEDRLHQILTAASNVPQSSPDRAVNYSVLVGGVPLESYLRDDAGRVRP